MSTTRPVPQRSLPGPARLTVAQRDLDGQIGSSSRSDVQALKSDLDRRKEITRKGEKWADRLMETTPTLPVFRKALTYLTPTQYLEITHERHLYNTCSYPACPNRSKRPFDTKKKIKISWSNRTISDCEGNPEDGFCQRSCHVKSDWVYDRLQEVSVWERSRGVVLLEDQESFGKGGDGEDRAGVKVKEHSIGQGGQGMGTKLPPVGVALSTSRPMEQAKETSKREPIGVEETTNKLGSLHIIERETPTTTPLAPSDPIPTTPNPPRPNPPQPISRREAGSLVQTPQQLSDTFLKASNQMGPVPQLPPEETGDDDHFLKEEEEMGLTWGVEDDEVRSLFKQAEMARNIEG